LKQLIIVGREKFILVAHDWGAAVGFHYVLKYMDTLEKYVMIGGPPPEIWKRLILKSPKQFFMSWYVFFFLMPYLPELFISLQDFILFDLIKIGSKEDIECYKYIFSRPEALTAPINYYRAVRVLFPDRILPKPARSVPGLFMLGEHDKYIARAVGKLAKDDYDNLDFKLIPGANHFAQQHKPDKTNQMIREFLEKK
jgi:epoxide hydrolase 4